MIYEAQNQWSNVAAFIEQATQRYTLDENRLTAIGREIMRAFAVQKAKVFVC
jgi:hypothetical protein